MVAHGGSVPVDGGELREGVGAVRLDREHVVGAVRLDDGALGVARGVQGVEGDHAAAQVDVLEQRAQRGDLAALARQQRLASGRPACVTSVTVSK